MTASTHSPDNTLGIFRTAGVLGHEEQYTIIHFECGCSALHDADDGHLTVSTRDWCALYHYLEAGLPRLRRETSDGEALPEKYR